ncbi:MAG: type II 3-dehydroquinate dehydratase [Schleiferiaceae bacterium]|nr:type II 3-dehydroquinate dehydratase [Schleiferiaceae bacterium]
MKIQIINGPNLNLLGSREPDVYGNQTFEDFLAQLKLNFPAVSFLYFQSNIEGELVSAIQNASSAACDGIIINAAAYTHTSIAIADALAAVAIPAVEVHISNVFQRESFRHHSYVAPKCLGSLSGFGLYGYQLAVDALLQHCKSQ